MSDAVEIVVTKEDLENETFPGEARARAVVRTILELKAENERLREFEARVRLILGADTPRVIDGWDMNDLLQSYEHHLKQSVLDEREACAGLVEKMKGLHGNTRMTLAAAIRARTP